MLVQGGYPGPTWGVQVLPGSVLLESGCVSSIWKPAVDIWQKTQDGPSGECYLWNMQDFTLWIVCFKNVQYNECLERTEERVIGKLESDGLVAKAVFPRKW